MKLKGVGVYRNAAVKLFTLFNERVISNYQALRNIRGNLLSRLKLIGIYRSKYVKFNIRKDIQCWNAT